MIPSSFFDCQLMKDIMIKKIAEYFLPVVSGILLVLSFPSFDYYLLAWVAFVPLMVSLWTKGTRQAFSGGYIFGLTYFFGTLYWIYHSINHFGGVPFLASLCIVILLCLYLGLYPAVFAFLFVQMLRKTKLPALLIAPVLWVMLEFARSYALTGFPWSSIGYSQYKFLQIIQIADITGVYGISFLVLMVNGAITDMLLLKKRVKQMPLFPISFTAVGLFVVFIIISVSLVYGHLRLGRQRSGDLVKAAIIQGNIEQDKKWEPTFQHEVLETYFTLSQEAAAASPQLIIWPETAIPFMFDYDKSNTEKLVDFQRGLGIDLLLGSVLVKERSQEKTLLTNSAVLLDKEGKNIYEYDKIHLVPFGEYVPLRSVLFFIDKLVAGIGDYVPGREYTRSETEFGSFGTMICYEIIFPGLVRKFFTDGGDFIVTITNDAWFGKTAGPYQHFSMAVFRAIENRKPVMRAANTGISGFIDSSGRVLSETPLFQRLILLGQVKTDRTLTFYTKYGDLFSYLCIVISIVLCLNIKIWR
jgi:apolipoprotein N-acyltransferase